MGPSSRATLPILAILVLLARAEDSGGSVWKGLSVSCNGEELANASVSCHGIRLVRRIVQKLLEDATRKRSLELLDGVSLVEREADGSNYMDARQLRGFGQMDTFVRFLESRELRINLPTLLPHNLESAIKESLPSIDQGRGHGGGGFGGGKKGDGGVMLMALMMGKMMAAMGFGALGLLAMKALMVSALALMLSLIVAAKKLASGKDEDSHHVVYAQEVSHHHRRRRSLDILQDNSFNQPYRGYMHLSHSILKS